jgi:hypothetical protein
MHAQCFTAAGAVLSECFSESFPRPFSSWLAMHVACFLRNLHDRAPCCATMWREVIVGTHLINNNLGSHYTERKWEAQLKWSQVYRQEPRRLEKIYRQPIFLMELRTLLLYFFHSQLDQQLQLVVEWSGLQIQHKLIVPRFSWIHCTDLRSPAIYCDFRINNFRLWPQFGLIMRHNYLLFRCSVSENLSLVLFVTVPYSNQT